MNKAGRLKLELMEERGYVCEYCRVSPAEHAHHCLFGRRKGHPEYDVKENLMLLCSGCHENKTGQTMKRVFIEIQDRRYGGTHMVEWFQGLHFKSKKENFI